MEGQAKQSITTAYLQARKEYLLLGDKLDQDPEMLRYRALHAEVEKLEAQMKSFYKENNQNLVTPGIKITIEPRQTRTAVYNTDLIEQYTELLPALEKTTIVKEKVFDALTELGLKEGRLNTEDLEAMRHFVVSKTVLAAKLVLDDLLIRKLVI
jgi:hypothetical protein